MILQPKHQRFAPQSPRAGENRPERARGELLGYVVAVGVAVPMIAFAFLDMAWDAWDWVIDLTVGAP